MALTTRAIILGGAAVVGVLTLASGAQAERHYDCTKAGNANKAVCKSAAAGTPTAAAAPAATATATTRHYDCSKAGNANKVACKAAVPATTAASTTMAPGPAKPSIFSRLKNKLTQPSPGPAASPTTNTVEAKPGGSYAGKSITTTPAGATGQCKDGTFTHATHHSGACSSHGGVAKWM